MEFFNHKIIKIHYNTLLATLDFSICYR